MKWVKNRKILLGIILISCIFGIVFSIQYENKQNYNSKNALNRISDDIPNIKISDENKNDLRNDNEVINSDIDSTNNNENIKGYIALIIDDFGNHTDGTKEMISMGIPITAAVMPSLNFTEKDAKEAHDAGVEVIMHVPMEPINGKPEWLGPNGIICSLSDEEIKSRIAEGLDQIKWAVGMNNHMGSKATQDKRVMKNIMEVAKERNLFFIDSLTSENSVVSSISDELGVTSFSRDIFLDNVKNKESIEKQMEKLGDIALKRGYAIGIGHVGAAGGSVTAAAIKTMYPILEEKGIKFIYVSQLKEVIKKER